MIRFTAEQEEFRKAVARFVDAEVAPAAEAVDERGEFPTKRSSSDWASSAISACAIPNSTAAATPTW
jgi:hypothetical protein